MSDYITPVMFTDPSGESIAGILGVLGSLGPAGWATIGVIALIAATIYLTPAVIEIAEAIETAHSAKNKNNYYVYTLINSSNEVFYVGITKDIQNRMRAHHERFGHFTYIEYGPMNEAQARVLETGLILEHGADSIIDVSPSSDKLLTNNRIKSISNRRYPGSLIINKIDSELRLLWEKLGGR